MNRLTQTKPLSRQQGVTGRKPVYLLAGGPSQRSRSHDPLIQEMLEETGRINPSVAYVGTASGDNPQFFKAIKTMLLQNGAGQVNLVPLAAHDSPHSVSQSLLDAADVIFFSGGDVDLGMRILRERGVTEMIFNRCRDGAVLSGLSAGSILLSRQWVRWRDPDDDSSVTLFDCLGVVPLICDMHDEEDDWEELKTLLQLRQVEGEIGYGIPASTGLRIHPDKRIEDIGGKVHRFIFRGGQVEPFPL